MPTKSLETLQDMVGETRLTVCDLHVEAGKVEEFARAIKDDNPAHRDREAAREQGFERIPAPLSFTRTAYFPRYQTDAVDGDQDWDLGFDPEYVVHGEQEYTFERPVLVGDILTGETTLEDVYQREGSRGGTMTFAVLVTRYYDADGDLVVTESKTRIETGEAIDEGGDDE